MTPKPHLYPAALPRSNWFQAKVNDLSLDVLHHQAAHHTSFECNGLVTVQLTLALANNAAAADVKIRPLRLGIVARREGQRITFDVPGPQNLQIEIPGAPLLYVYALPPAAPSPTGPKVRLFEAGKIHDAGLVVLGEGETLWIEAGAVMRGSIRAAAVSGVRIGGYGILDGSYWVEHLDTRRKAIVLDHCKASSIETILMVSPCHWMIVLGACADISVSGVRQIADDMSSDGVDIAGSQRVRVTGCCLHNGDDNIAIKAIGNTSHPSERALTPMGLADEGWKYDVEDIVVSGCTFYNIHGGSAMEIGYETSTPHIRNIRFENIDVLAVHQFGSVFGIHIGDRAHVENVIWENIRVEHHYDKLVDLRVVKSRWNVDAERGRVSNITLRNIKAVQSTSNAGYTVSVIAGYDAQHPITGVSFENFELGGRVVQNGDELDLVTRNAHGITYSLTARKSHTVAQQLEPAGV
jgi:hypothetical protein